MAIKTYGKYTGYLTDPWSGEKVPYDERYPQQKERLMKKHREAEATLGPLTEAAAYYQPGGGFGKGVEAGLERERTQAMSSGMQALVSSGFAGTTMAGGLGKKFAEEVGMPTRMRVEETRAERLSAIKMLRAQLAQAKTEAERQRISQQLMAQLAAKTSTAASQLGAETSLATSRIGARASLASGQLGAKTQLMTTGMREAGAMERLLVELESKKQEPFIPSTTTFDDSASPFSGVLGSGEQAARSVGGVGTPTQGFWGASEKWRSEQPDWVTG